MLALLQKYGRIRRLVLFLALLLNPGQFLRRPRKGESTSLERELQPPNDSAVRNLSLMLCFYLLFCLVVLFFVPTSFCLISSFLGFKRVFVFFWRHMVSLLSH